MTSPTAPGPVEVLARSCSACRLDPAVLLCPRHRQQWERWSAGHGLLPRDFLDWHAIPVSPQTATDVLSGVRDWSSARRLRSLDGLDFDTWTNRQIRRHTVPGPGGTRLAAPDAELVAAELGLTTSWFGPGLGVDESVRRELLGLWSSLGVDTLPAAGEFAVAALFVGAPPELVGPLWTQTRDRAAVSEAELASIAAAAHLDAIDDLLAWRQVVGDWAGVVTVLKEDRRWLRCPDSLQQLRDTGLFEDEEDAVRWHAAAARVLTCSNGARFGPSHGSRAVTLPLIARWRRYGFDVPTFTRWESVLWSPRYLSTAALWPHAPALLRALLDVDADESQVLAWFEAAAHAGYDVDPDELAKAVRAGAPVEWGTSFANMPTPRR